MFLKNRIHRRISSFSACYYYCCYLLLLLLSASKLLAIEQASQLQYQTAANYSHLKWTPLTYSPLNIQILPLQNFSGVPMQQRNEKSDYFYHGKIPLDIQLLFSSLINSTHYFKSHAASPDYRFQLSIENYQLPYHYAPDDVWWEKLHDNVDRLLTKEKEAVVTLSLEIMGVNRPFPLWKESVKATISYCQLNQQIQPLYQENNQNTTLNQYLKSTPGQAFVSASNYLILRAIEVLHRQHRMAKVVTKSQNELLLIAENGQFILGQKLDLYYQQSDRSQSALAAGQVEIIKTYRNQAVAYPVDLRFDHIQQGDWVKIGKGEAFNKPPSLFIPTNQCSSNKLAQQN